VELRRPDIALHQLILYQLSLRQKLDGFIEPLQAFIFA
jgi:hypothetical protein